MTTSSTAERTWLGLHCYLHWASADIDSFLTGVVAPLLDGLRDDGRIADWFFIRYWEGGPHLRIRVAGADAATAGQLRSELTREVGAALCPIMRFDTDPGAQRLLGHGVVNEVEYLAETDRYGGPDAIAVAEETFCRSTHTALHLIRTAATTTNGRLAAAAELAVATALALGLDRIAASRWLRGYASSWRWQTEAGLVPPIVSQTQVVRVLATQTPALQLRWDRVAEAVRTDLDGAGSPLSYWATEVRRARRLLEETGSDEPLGTAARHWQVVWSSQLHMLLNRLGVTPDEERSVCWLMAGAALNPNGLAPYFDDGPTAPDRAFLEAGKYLPGRAQQDPVDVEPTSDADHRRSRWPTSRPTPLPMADLGSATLAGALRRRGSAQGRAVGPITAIELGTLLWTAHGTTGVVRVRAPHGVEYSLARRPYPSAGQKYPAGLRLIVRDVAGLEPGCYHVDGVERVLWRIGPAPSLSELDATTPWLGAAEGGAERPGISELPALLGLYVHMEAVRARYGLRALRFVFLEAGHLAQNLGLVAAASGLSLGVIGGFYDDLAHELLGLDGVDDLLAYLMPVGRLGTVG